MACVLHQSIFTLWNVIYIRNPSCLWVASVVPPEWCIQQDSIFHALYQIIVECLLKLLGLIVGSQVCNLAWSKNVNEIVSTHGYSQNQVVIWKYPSMTKLTTLTGHSTRVLYLATSPDGQTIVTGAGNLSILKVSG